MIVRCEKVYFDILSRLGMDQECDTQRDGRTDITIANVELNYFALPISA